MTLETGAPVESIRCLAGPTRPRASPVFTDGDFVWRLVSHLTLNYLSLVNNDERHAARRRIRDLLTLYGDAGDAPTRKQIEGVRSVASQTITRRIPTPGPITFGRGLEIAVTCDEAAFEGTGMFLLGAVLEQFFARYASLNSFTETVLQQRRSRRGNAMAGTDRAAADRLALRRAEPSAPTNSTSTRPCASWRPRLRERPRIGRSLRPADDPVRASPAALAGLRPRDRRRV